MSSGSLISTPDYQQDPSIAWNWAITAMVISTTLPLVAHQLVIRPVQYCILLPQPRTWSSRSSLAQEPMFGLRAQAQAIRGRLIARHQIRWRLGSQELGTEISFRTSRILSRTCISTMQHTVVPARRSRSTSPGSSNSVSIEALCR